MFADYNIIKKTSPLAFSLGESGGKKKGQPLRNEEEKDTFFEP